MIKLNEQQVNQLENHSEIGKFFDLSDGGDGAFIDEEEFVLVYQDTGIYLAHRSEFEFQGILIRIKESNA
jgi:hypothetical protein